MTSKIPDTLEAKIEQMVREHLSEQQAAAKAAIERAFAAVAPSPRTGARRRAAYRRRPPSEVAELADQLLKAVQACPGETMTVIAERVGAKPRSMHRPMMHLKKSGRVRSAGERNFTRYFPMTGGKSA